MEAKFTKGEWDAVIYSGEHKVEVWSGDDQIYANGSVTNKEMDFANAHLIAAAPDMYELLDRISKGEQVWSTNECIALLQKARGEQ